MPIWATLRKYLYSVWLLKSEWLPESGVRGEDPEVDESIPFSSPTSDSGNQIPVRARRPVNKLSATLWANDASETWSRDWGGKTWRSRLNSSSRAPRPWQWMNCIA